MADNENDELFYSDLIYLIKQLAGFQLDRNEETEIRIEDRQKDIKLETGEGSVYRFSKFSEEFFDTMFDIFYKANEKFINPKDISKYPEIVNDTINEIEAKANIDKCSVSKKYDYKIIKK